jgi:hypothetical protein
MIECPEYLSDIEHHRSLETKPSNSVVGVTRKYSVTHTPDNGTKLETTISKPFYFGHQTLLEPSLPKVNVRMFMNRFRRSQE